MNILSICVWMIFFLLCINHNLVPFCDNNMTNLNKLDFTTLEVSNSLKWVQDVKHHLNGKSLQAIIAAKKDISVCEVDKATAMIFIRRHMHDELQNKYLAKKDPQALWITLEDRFDHSRDIFSPEERHDWKHLRF